MAETKKKAPLNKSAKNDEIVKVDIVDVLLDENNTENLKLYDENNKERNCEKTCRDQK